ncbi:MAG: methyltransferase domain-containing protein [Nanoarchaeota archaeon]
MKKLNFGCGIDVWGGADNVDVQESDKLTKSFDFDKFPYPIKENSYDFIYSRNVLEHVDKPDKVIMELWRIAKPGAIIKIIVPHYTNKGAYSDVQHRHFYNEIAFKLMEDPQLGKKLDNSQKFKVKKLVLVPSKIGKFMPKKLREKLALFVNGLLSEIDVEYQVIK